jgi:anti-sigma B factor antagonist
MAIKETIKNDVAVLIVSGKLMGGPETLEVHEHVKSLISDGIKKIVIDLGKVKWMNSSGLGALMASLSSIKNAGGTLKLANVTEKVQSLFMITQLITIFETYQSVDRAVASFLGENKK